MKKNALLVLEDGTVFRGKSFGAEGERFGELVFNTGMTGYQEILTDPSCRGQIVTMSYPLIGNYGINEEDSESDKAQVAGLIVRERCEEPSNWRSKMTLQEFLIKHNVIGIEEIDTREIVQYIRTKGTMNSVISTVDTDEKSLLKKVKAWKGLDGVDLVKEVTCKEVHVEASSDTRYHVVAFDYGIKNSVVKKLVEYGCKVTVVPAYTTSEQALSYNPDGLFLSNGPGDPRTLKGIIKTCKELIGKKPMLGICLGHEIIGLALGAEIKKMKFGHRGCNQPINDLKKDKVLITSENHGWAIAKDTIPDCLEVSRLNLNDGTVEGLRHKTLPLFSIQCNPEASPDKHNSYGVFEEFIEMMEHNKKKSE